MEAAGWDRGFIAAGQLREDAHGFAAVVIGLLASNRWKTRLELQSRHPKKRNLRPGHLQLHPARQGRVVPRSARRWQNRTGPYPRPALKRSTAPSSIWRATSSKTKPSTSRTKPCANTSSPIGSRHALLRKPFHHHDQQPPAGRMRQTLGRRAHRRGDIGSVFTSRPIHRHHREKLPRQRRDRCRGKQKAAEARRTLDRETGELRLEDAGSARFYLEAKPVERRK